MLVDEDARMKLTLTARVYSLCLSLSLALTSLGCAARIQPDGPGRHVGAWTEVQALKAGTRVVTYVKGTGYYEGFIRTVSEDGITLAGTPSGRVVPRSEIQAVVHRKRSAWSRARIGFGVGALIGGTSAAITYSDSCVVFRNGLVSGLLGLAVGALHGLADRDRVVYAVPIESAPWQPRAAVR